MDTNGLVYNGKDNNTFNSAMIWLITCVFVAILPIILSYLYESLSQHKLVNITFYLRDILLITFSISCSVLVISLDKSKFIDKNYKQIAMLFAGLSAAISGSYYFFLSGYLVHSEKSAPGENIMVAISILCIIICTIIGCVSQNNHDKNSKKYKQLMKKIIKNSKEKKG